MFLRFREDFVVGRRLIFVVVGLDVILPHRVVGEFVPHEDAAKVGMAVEVHAVEIENLPLLEFRASPDRGERRHWGAEGTIAGA